MTVDFTKRDGTRTTPSSQAASYDMGMRKHMIKVYNTMAMGVGITGLVAFLISQMASQSPEMMATLYNSPLRWVIMFAPLGFIFFLGAKMQKMSESGAKMMFYSFAAVMGLSLSSIFIIYTGESITRVFFISAASFGSLSLWGYTTKKDISGWGSFLIMGVVGIIIASVVNIFMQSEVMDLAISVIGVFAFAGLTAYDTQKIKTIYRQYNGAGNTAIYGALTLYLDFINLMMFMLRLLGNRD